MDEEDRKTKVLAGKDAFLAFQKKKEKKSKRNKTKSNVKGSLSAVNSLILDTSDGSFVSDMTDSSLLVDTESNDKQQSVDNTVDTMGINEPFESGKSLHITDSGLVSDVYKHNQEMDTSSRLHNDIHSSESQVLELTLSKLRNENTELQSRLSQVQENYQSAILEAEEQVTSQYQNEITTLKSTLVAMETTLQKREQELKDINTVHSLEIERVFQKQEEIRNALLKEQNDKLSSEIAHLREQLASHDNPIDETEREAQRIRDLKEKMKQLNEQEKESIQLAHQKEKQMLIEEHEKKQRDLAVSYQQRMEDNKKQLEQLANDQIKQLHSQFVTAHTTLNNQKIALETELKQHQENTQALEEKVATLEKMKQNAERELLRLQESHSSELHSMKQSSIDLERRLNEWKEKASNLEVRIDHSSQGDGQHISNESVSDIRAAYESDLQAKEKSLEDIQEELKRREVQYTDAMTSSQRRYEEMLSSRDKLIKELEKRVETINEQHQQEIFEIQQKHESDLDEIEAKHSSQVSLLEESKSETSMSQASLEFAEAHMKELQQQLNAYRNQETSHKAALEALEKQHIYDLQQLQRDLSNKDEHIEKIAIEHETDIDNLKKEVIELKCALETKETQYKKEMDDLAITKEEDYKKSLEKLRVEIDSKHSKEIESLIVTHTNELNSAETIAENQFTSRLNDIQVQLSEERQIEIQQIREENDKALQQLKTSLATTGEQALTDAKSRIIDLENKLRENEIALREMRTLQESCQKYQTELRSCQVDLSLCQSEQRKERQQMEKLNMELEDWKAKCLENESLLDDCKKTHCLEVQELKKQFHSTLQVKEDEIATHHSHVKSYQSRITELTEELAQEREIMGALKIEVQKSSHLIDESVSKATELNNVRVQLEEAKQRCSSLMNEWKDKESERSVLQDKLSSEQEMSTKHEQEYSQRIDSLVQQVSEKDDMLLQIRKQLEEANNQCLLLKTDKGELSDTTDKMKHQVDSLNTQISELKQEHVVLQEDRSNTEQRLLDSLNLVEQLRGEMETQDEDLERLQKEHEQVCEERIELLARVTELESQVTNNPMKDMIEEQANKIEGLETQLVARETAMKKLHHDFTRQLTESVSKQQSLQQQIVKSQRVGGKMSTLLNERGDLEKSLVRSRQALIEKLREKELLEKDLNFHRTELEHRLSEKQRLEEVLFEKSRFEQELRNQKEQLQIDLDGIEKKLQVQDSEFETGRINWSDQLNEDDSLNSHEYTNSQNVMEQINLEKRNDPLEAVTSK